MAGQVYALFVGIDDYPAPVPRLRGCVNDVTTLRDVLRARVGDRLQARVLLDDEATREGLTAAFAEHLGQAGPDDVALFYYSGHGSQQRVPEELAVEGDLLDETLVLHDSRGDGGRDLADKELAAWIAAVAERDAHVVVVLDCCHSGSGTRAIDEDGERERRAPTDDRPRSLADYRAVLDAAAALGGRGTGDAAPGRGPASGGPSGWAQPRAPHVLLATCRSTETAKELHIGGRTRGVLSAALETALTTSSSPTYRELHRFVVAQARSRVRQQNPQLETSEAGDLERPFLGGHVGPRPTTFVLAHEEPVGWVVDAGSLHGLPHPVANETTHLAVLPDDVTAGDGGDDGTGPDADARTEPLATASIVTVEPGRSTVRVDPADALDPGRTYRAVVTALPLAPVRVVLSGDADALAALRAVLPGRPGSERSTLVAETTHPDAELSVEATASGYRVGRPGSTRALVAPVEGSGPDAAERAALVLEHVARWTRVAALRNPTSRLTGAVRVELTLDGGPVAASAARGGPGGSGGSAAGGVHASPDGVVRARYTRDPDGTERLPELTLTLTNTLPDRPLWCAVLDLPGDYSIHPGGHPAGVVELAPGAVERVALEGELPDVLAATGFRELDELLKVVVSTEEFDPRGLRLDALDVTRRTAPPAVRDLGEPRSTLDRLLQRAATRVIRPRPSAGEPRADWTTVDVVLSVERPAAGVPLGDAPVVVVPGVTVEPHPALRGSASVGSSAVATRDLDAPPLPAALRDVPDQSAPFPLTATRGDVDVLDTLALTDLDPAAVALVTPEQPLRLHLDTPLAEDERLLVTAWDGEFHVPLGAARRAPTGTDVVLERLTPPVTTERDLVGSVTILFRKLIGKRLGLDYRYPLLRRAVVEDGALRYEDDVAAVRTAVGAADAVLLYVHGIIGDTAGMALSSGHTALVPPPPLLAGRHDVVLTFDYENINTSIAQNARLLRERLADVGLDGTGAQRLDVVAHSMGGLVSRHLIELRRPGEPPLVDRLVTLGTPNGGSPWPTVQKLATVAVTVGLNGLTAAAWPLGVVATLLGALEKVDVALDEMEPSSDLLDELAAAPDPGVPYTVLVGTRSFAAQRPRESGALRRLLARLHPARLVEEVVDAVFLDLPNDIAVSVPSGRSVPTDRSPAPVVHEVPSDHMTYFQDAEALAALATALGPR